MSRILKPDQNFKAQKLAKTSQRRHSSGQQRLSAETSANRQRNDLNPDLHIAMQALSDLQPVKQRLRQVQQDHVARLMQSITSFGFALPILVADGEIIDGNTRVEAARQLGLSSVPAIEVAHLSAAELRTLRITLNRTAELGVWDLDALKIELTELAELDVDLSLTGFSGTDLDIILLNEDAGTQAEEDDLDPAPTIITQSGDVWFLGEHRIMCGNALDEAAMAKLFDGRNIHCVLTDPPYNVPIAGNVSGLGKKTHAEFAMASGEMNAAQWQSFLNQVMAVATTPLVEGGVVFAFMDWRSIHRLYTAGEAAGLTVINLAVWYKEAGSMGSLYRSAHELVGVFCKGKAPRINNVALGKNGRDRSNVWLAPGANRRGSSAHAMLEHHATPKPVELCVDALLDVTQRGDHVLDLFLGSGTTLIAAEKTGRICFGVEIEPQFVDVAIRRWEKLTGKDAILQATGQSFAAVAAQRTASNEEEHDA